MPERLIVETERDAILKQLHLARYDFAASYVSGKTVLDVACGTGYGSAMLRNHGANRVFGIDISADAIGYAATHYLRDGLEYLVGDAHDLPPLPHVDTIVTFETIEHLSDPKRFLAAAKQRLGSDGTLLVSSPMRRSGELTDKPENPFHTMEWNVKEFTELLHEFFDHVEVLYQFNFKKSWYPGSRTISRKFAGFLYPARTKEFVQFRVSPIPIRLPGIPVIPEYMIALCRDHAGEPVNPSGPNPRSGR